MRTHGKPWPESARTAWEKDSTRRPCGPRGPTSPHHGPSLPLGGWARRGLSRPTSGVPAGTAHARPNPPGNRDQPPLPPPRLPPPPPPRSGRPGPSPRDMSILSRFSLLRAFGGGGWVAVAPNNRVPNRFMTGAAASEQSAGKARVSGPPPPTHARRLAAARSAHARWLRPHPPTLGGGRGGGLPRRTEGQSGPRGTGP